MIDRHVISPATSRISPTTACLWRSTLQLSGQGYLLEPWFGSAVKRLVKAPKLHLSESDVKVLRRVSREFLPGSVKRLGLICRS